MIRDLLTAHMDRLIVSAIVSIIVGAVFALRPDEAQRTFGWMTVGWALVNLAIAIFGRMDRSEPNLAQTREFLAFNLGLNIAYIAVAIALMALGKPAVRGAGLAVAIQGVLLLVLDGYLFWRLPSGTNTGS